ncbi:Protein of unknown function [Pyronema omphalodes CBS 100304]|uniref:Uncharacterized protein n=1 Tax=Pyronema omphalodes (strain CBS 100304) TaxID=1076935 RepID=U4LCP8_PYROM|nr:Protein of unknown function [Pyronema omphalodes CBS 100304]
MYRNFVKVQLQRIRDDDGKAIIKRGLTKVIQVNKNKTLPKFQDNIFAFEDFLKPGDQRINKPVESLSLYR